MEEKLKEKLFEIYEDVSYDINTVWEDTYEDVDVRTDTIKSILSFFGDNKEVKDELIHLINYYVYKTYEEINYIRRD